MSGRLAWRGTAKGNRRPSSIGARRLRRQAGSCLVTEWRKVPKIEVSKPEIAVEHSQRRHRIFPGTNEFILRDPLGSGGRGIVWGSSPRTPTHLHVSLEGRKGADVGNKAGTVRRGSARKSQRVEESSETHERRHLGPMLTIDPLFAAEWHIEQALVNFHRLKLTKSAAIYKFEDHHNRKLRTARERHLF